jgi:hypothetical protein
MYHLQLRQFPNHATRFNLTEHEVRAVLEPWAREQIVEMGERKWAPERATLTVLEGPELEVQQLAMGRGWRAAERASEDVTERMLAATAQRLQSAATASPAVAGTPVMETRPASDPGTPGPARQASPAHSTYAVGPPLADPLGLAVQLASLLGSDPERLLGAWREVAARSSGLAPSEALALAERQIARSSSNDG